MGSRHFQILLRLMFATTVGLSLSGCGAGGTSNPASTRTVTVTEAAATAKVVETTRESTPPGPTEDPTMSEPVGTSTASGREEPFFKVAPVDFRGPDGYDGYFFISPSGNLSCGVWDWDPALAGCQSWSLVENLPECDDPLGASSPAIEFFEGQPADAYCSAEGMFWAEAPVLEYGQQLRVAGVTCTSRATGVTCLDENTGSGFTAARAGFVPFD